jgi:hypothetical protein
MIGRTHRGRTDRIHREVVDALRRYGATVVSLGVVGNGCPDLLVGYHAKHTLLFEVKDGMAIPSKKRLTEAEIHFQATWTGGNIYIVYSAEEALKVLVSCAD